MLLSDHPYLLQSQALLFLSVRSQFNEETGRPSVPIREFNLSMPASPITLKKPLPDLNPGWREPARPAGTVAY